MASIRIRPSRVAGGDPTYSVRWREDGHETSYPLEDLQSARNFVRLLEANGNRLKPTLVMMDRIDDQTPTVRMVLAEHIDGLSSVTARTRKDYRRDAATHIEPHLGHVRVDEVTPARVRQWVRVLAAQRTPGTDDNPDGELALSDKTLRNVHGLLSSTMTTAVEVGYRPDNPCHGIKLPRREAEHENFAFTPEQWRAMDAEIGRYVRGWYQPLYRFLIATGIRWGEATALQVRDLVLDGDSPQVRIAKAYKRDENSRAYVGPTKTKMSRRTIGIPASVAADLVEHVAGKAPGDLVFPGPRGGPVLPSNARARVWLPAIAALKAAGIIDHGSNPRAHDLRHTYATWAIAGGVDMLTVQHTMGHESITTTTKTYATVMPSQTRSAAAAIEAALKR